MMRAYQRLLGYVTFDTASDGSSPTCPSTPGQKLFGQALVDEMLAMGISDAAMDENGYVFGTIPATNPNAKTVLGLIAHMDVVADVPWTDIKATLVENYDGKDLCLNSDKNIWLRPAEFSALKNYVGHDLVVTDGTTLLGADDKAGIAEILTLAELLLGDTSIPHGVVKIGFTPDEEIGRGADLFDVKRFGADFAYTIDGGGMNEVSYETFSGATLEVSIAGKNIHPGQAKDKMINAVEIAGEFDALLPAAQRPQHTAEREGFFHLTKVHGIVEQAEMRYIIRDHNAARFGERKVLAENVARFLNEKYGAGTITVKITDSYYNMEEKILPHQHLLDNAFEAIRRAGGEPITIPVRGGTDGSRLSYMGLPCPNLGTGSHNHHGKLEYASCQAMDSCVQMLLELVKLYGV